MVILNNNLVTRQGTLRANPFPFYSRLLRRLRRLAMTGLAVPVRPDDRTGHGLLMTPLDIVGHGTRLYLPMEAMTL
jgi:hypothetical protein